MALQVFPTPRSVRRLLLVTAASAALAATAGSAPSAGATTRPLQVSSATALGDIQPTDESFVALLDLVSRYGCMAGYPDGIAKGTRAVTRYEFAALLSACLERIGPGVAATPASSPDRVTLARLQERFAAELATLKGRVDALEARTAALEALQFSTTNKLGGQVTLGVSIPTSTSVKKPRTTVRPTTTKGKARVPKTTPPTATKPTS